MESARSASLRRIHSSGFRAPRGAVTVSRSSRESGPRAPILYQNEPRFASRRLRTGCAPRFARRVIRSGRGGPLDHRREVSRRALRSTPSARCRSTPSRRRIPAIPACRSAPRRWPTSSGTVTSRTIPAIRTGRTATASCSSAGHGSALLYSLLHLTGYDLGLDDLKAFRQWGSRTPGHPEVHLTPGVEATTGPLGQGTANAVGMAMAERFLAHRFNRPGHEIVSHRTFCLVGDGDLMEGISGEAGSLAGHLKLGKLVYLYDDNHVTLDGPAKQSFTEDVLARYAAYGWQVLRVENGNTDLDGIDRAIRTAVSQEERPTIIAVRTTIGYGSPHKAGTTAAHGSPLGVEEVALTKKDARLGVDGRVSHPEGSPRAPAFGRRPRRKGRGRVAAALRGVREGVPGSRRGVARRREGRAAERLGRRPSEVEGGRIARDPRGVRQGHQRDRQARAGASRRRRRPLRVDEDPHRRRGRVRRPDRRREQHPLRRARARDGGDRQRHGLPRRRASVRRHLLLLLGLHAPVDPPRGPVAPADDLRLDARLDRPRRGRARRTRPSSSSCRCGRCRTSRSSAPATRTRPRRPGARRSSTARGPWASCSAARTCPSSTGPARRATSRAAPMSWPRRRGESRG